MDPRRQGGAAPAAPSRNFVEALIEVAARRPTAIAIDGPDERVSYDALAAGCLGVAASLRRAGVGPGDRVAIFLPRSGVAAAAFFGVLAAGGVAVIVNESLKARQIEHIVGHSGAATLLTTPDMLTRLERWPATAARVIDVSAPAEPDATAHSPRFDSDVAQIIYTSGSTGRPKGVALSHANLWAGMDAVMTYLDISPDDRIASLLPFSFDYGLNQLLCAVGAGASLVIERSPVPHRIVESLRERGVTVLAAVPPLWLQLLSVGSFTRDRLPRLRAMTNTGGHLPVTAVRQLRAAQPHAALYLMYGLTEAFRSSYLDPHVVDRKPTSVGRAIPGAELSVVRSDGRPCDPGEVGELVHRGPTVALGYWDDPEHTATVFRPYGPGSPAGADTERVVFSGDLVRRDADGDLFVIGREDGLIKTMGYRVSPDEVAEVLHASGQVDEVVVASEADDQRGANIIAYVVLADGGELDRLHEFCRAELPRYLQPARIEVRPSLERTPSGKYDVSAVVGTRHR